MPSLTNPSPAVSQHRTPPAASQAPVPVTSEALLRGHKTVDIIHHGTIYRLQATKLGKLILTK